MFKLIRALLFPEKRNQTTGECMAVKAAQEATGTEIVMIVSCHHQFQKDKDKLTLLAPEGISPLSLLDYAHEQLVRSPQEGKYTEAQIRMQLDFWLDKLNEYTTINEK